MVEIRVSLAASVLFVGVGACTLGGNRVQGDGEEGTGTEAGSGEEGPAGACGNGVVDEGEECDAGAMNGTENSTCAAGCVMGRCGDGVAQRGLGEACDDGNQNEDDSCTSACEPPVCGDGFAQPSLGEDCDDGNTSNLDECLSDCSAPSCGDGFVRAGVEECDDQNDENADGCTVMCLRPACGDGFVHGGLGELCDDGNDVEGDGCNGDCKSAGLWTDTDDVAGNNDELYGAAHWGAGPVVVGSAFEGSEQDNLFVRRYGEGGSVTWTQTVHRLTAEIGHGVAVASDSALVIAGERFGLPSGKDAWLVGMDGSGTVTWETSWSSPDARADAALAVDVASDGTIYVAGYATNPAGERDLWYGAFDSGGTELWTRSEDGGADGNDEARGIAVAPGGGAVVVGYVWSGSDGRDAWMRRIDGSGGTTWTTTTDGARSGNDEANAVAATDDGFVVVGALDNGGDGTDIWIRRIDGAGAEQWTQMHDGRSNGNDVGNAVVVDAGGAIIVAGSEFLAGGARDNAWVAEYNGAGEQQWFSEYRGEGHHSDVARGVAVDPSGRVTAAGYETRADLDQARNVWVQQYL